MSMLASLGSGRPGLMVWLSIYMTSFSFRNEDRNSGIGKEASEICAANLI